MIPPIRIQLMTGPQSGLQTTHTQARVSFGREAGNTVVLEQENLSRRHGELVCVDGQWAVVNLSPNGTTVNGRAVKGEQPRPVKPGDVIGVGKNKLFAVQYQPGSTGAPADDAGPRQPVDAGNRMSRRGKLWTAIGIYIGVMLVVFVVLMMVRGGGDGGGRTIPKQINDSVIEAEILQPVERSRDERKAREHLEIAENLYPTATSTTGGLYKTYTNYKLSLAFSGDRKFEDIAQLHFVGVEKLLLEKITHDYAQAYAMVAKQQWVAAEDALFDLINAYPATASNSPVYKNFNELLSYVKSKRKRR